MSSLSEEKQKEINALETEDTKLCLRCKVVKPLFEFNFDENKRKFAASHCLECQKEKHMLYRYNMTIKDYDKMLKEQGGACMICRTKTPGGNGRFYIDHDHPTGKIRGLLCHNCNVGLGNFKDDPEILIAAAQYLLKTKPNKAGNP